MAPKNLDLKNNPENMEILKKALANSPKAVLEGLVLETSQNDGRAAKVFWDALVTTKGGKTKTNKPKFDTCKHCKQGYDIAKNGKDGCVWHCGNLIVDEDVWYEYSEIDQGPIDSKVNRKERPQGFYWDCCGLQLQSAGCLKSEHAPLAVLKRNGHTLKEIESERTTARWNRDIHGHHENHHSAGPSPSKKRKVDESSVCRWHDLDAVRRYTGKREDWDSDDDGDQLYSENEGFQDEDEDVEDGRTIRWTCCGWNEKEGGGCILTPHLPPRMTEPKVPAEV
ncbi:hypothetical protein C8R45DRAFT_1193505 [Mycena sanguinolenta]|nr:hypothetical protein C8R45DRAFT_1193505 [Mycena sanguinolenta]